MQVYIIVIKFIEYMSSEMRAWLESKNNSSNSNITKIEGLKYLDKPIKVSMKMTMFKENKMQIIDTMI